jgi:hypothetical protein
MEKTVALRGTSSRSAYQFGIPEAAQRPGGFCPKIIVHILGAAVGFKVKRRGGNKPLPLPKAKVQGMPAGFGAYAARSLKGRKPFPLKKRQGLRRYKAVPGFGGERGNGPQNLQAVYSDPP